MFSLSHSKVRLYAKVTRVDSRTQTEANPDREQMVALGATFLETKVILFLDFDGVLHPDEAYLVNGRPVLRAVGALFMWTPLLKNFPGVQIFLRTSWARELRFTRARSFLAPDLQQCTIGAAWHSRMASNDYGDLRTRNRNTWWDRATRHQQIRRSGDMRTLRNG